MNLGISSLAFIVELQNMNMNLYNKYMLKKCD